MSENPDADSVMADCPADDHVVRVISDEETGEAIDELPSETVSRRDLTRVQSVKSCSSKSAKISVANDIEDNDDEFEDDITEDNALARAPSGRSFNKAHADKIAAMAGDVEDNASVGSDYAENPPPKKSNNRQYAGRSVDADMEEERSAARRRSADFDIEKQRPAAGRPLTRPADIDVEKQRPAAGRPLTRPADDGMDKAPWSDADESAPCLAEEEYPNTSPRTGTRTSSARSVHRAPGAVNVRGRAPGSAPEWALNSNARRAANQSQRSAFTQDSHKTFEVIAHVVKDDEDDEKKLPTVYPIEVKSGEALKRKRQRRAAILCVLVFCLVGMGAALIVTQTGILEKKEPVIDSSQSTLEQVLQRGKLLCGVPPKTDFSYLASVDFCKGIAGAIFGVQKLTERYELVENEPLSLENLAAGKIDVSTKGWVHTLEHEVYIATEKTGFSFSEPLFYTGLMFGGDAKYAKCAENLNVEGECANLKICADGGSSTIDQLYDLFPQENLRVVIATQSELYQHLKTNTCNVIAGVPPVLSNAVAVISGYTDEFTIGNGIFSKEPFALVTRNDDPRWSDFINWFLQALFAADEKGITKRRADDMPTTQAFGNKFENMFINAVAAMGNYGEVYKRHFGLVAARSGANLRNDGSTGRIFSHPFGSLLEDTAPGHIEGGTLDKIMERGHLKCGIIRRDAPDGGDFNPKGLSGLDVDYCYALSAAIFEDDLIIDATYDKTRFVTIKPKEAFALLSIEDVDVLGLAPLNLENDVQEPSTGEGYSFSQPVYYPFNGVDDPRALATREDDAQWSSFVYWTVSASFYAEEKGITKDTAYEMPLVNLFGSQHKMMMRNLVRRSGNYGEMYARNIDKLGPRGGLNLLNDAGGPQIYGYPGIFDK